MSRTYRRLKVLEEKTVVTHIKDTICYFRRSEAAGGWCYDKQIKIRKSDDEYNAELAAANERYEADCRAVRKLHWSYWYKPDSPMYNYYLRRLPRKHDYFVGKYRYEYIKRELKEELDYAYEQYDRYARDGYWSETSCNRTYKKLSTNTVRQAVRSLEHKIMKDEDWDHLPYPDRYLGKKHIWDACDEW